MQTIHFSLLTILILFSACGKKTIESTTTRKDLTAMIFASGTLQPENQYNLTAQADGYLIHLDFKEGDIIHKGQVLAIIDNQTSSANVQSAEDLLAIAQNNAQSNAPALQQVQANINVAKEKIKQDQLQADRYTKLYASNSISKLEYENAQLTLTNSKATLEALQQQFNTIKQQADQQVVIQNAQSKVNKIAQSNNIIKAIIGGKVYKKNKELGDFVRRGDVIATIADPAILYAKLSVDESNMSKINLGQEAIIQLNIDKNKNYKATIKEILPTFDESTQSFICKAYFIDTLLFNISGTQLQANIILETKKNALVIPRNYLGYGNKVMVKKGSETTNIIVKTGIISSEWVEIVEGLQDNQTIVTDIIK